MQKPTISSLKSKLDNVFSEYIRKRDSDGDGMVKCVTCGKVMHWKQVDCGHFVSRAKLNTRWDERNASGQCKQCNGFAGGQQYLHGLALEKRWGKGTADLMFAKSCIIRQMKSADYLWLINEFREKIKQLEA